jgi:RNA polymerase sigma-70 factor (TIGR02943 family)
MDISGPDTTIRSWVDLYADKMYTWALYKTSIKEIAEDLVQDTFLAAFQSISKFEGKSEPKTWLFAILNNKIAEHFRKQFRNPTITESQSGTNSGTALFDTLFDANDQWIKEQRPKEWQDDQPNLLDDPAFIKVLQACMSKLPGNWMAAIQLKYLEEKKGELICQELGIAPTNFWQILHRAKLQLRKCLEFNWFKK